MGSCLYSVRINGDIFVEYNSKRNRTEHQYRQNNPMNVSQHTESGYWSAEVRESLKRRSFVRYLIKNSIQQNSLLPK